MSAFPTTPILDDFLVYPDGPLSAKWANLNPGSFQDFAIQTNEAVDSNPAAGGANAYWVPATAGPNCEAYVLLNGVDSSDIIRVFARLRQVGAGTWDGYCVSANVAQQAWTIQRADNGVVNNLTVPTSFPHPIGTADGIGIRIIGNLISSWHLDVTQPDLGWHQVQAYDISADATKYNLAGFMSMQFRFSAATQFGGGTYGGAVQLVSAGSVSHQLPLPLGVPQVGS